MLEALLRPKSVALIGASRTPGKVGHAILTNLIEGGDDFKRQAEAFRRRLTRPVATDLRFDFSGVEVYDVEPLTLPNLYHGMPDLVPPLAAESAGLEPSIRTALRTELLRASAMLDNQPATIALAEESLRDGSDLDGLYYALGRSYENAGRHADALGAFRQAEIRDWYEPEFSRAQARCLRSLGRSGEAQEMEAKAQGKEEFHGGMGPS